MEANASHGAVRGREDVAVQSASDATRVSAFSVDLWRLLLFVAVQSASDATRVSAFSVLGLTCVAVEAASICCCAVCE